MKNTNIEVEGGELLLMSEEGHYAVIPAKHRQEVMDMVKDDCDDCINAYIQTLPKDSDYAEDGTLIGKIKSTKLNPKNWGVSDYSDKGDFNTAYASAKKAGEKEFMWNNKRYNTKYAGTVQEEVKSYFPEYNVITGVEPGNYVKSALHMIDESKSPEWPHVFTGDLNKKTAIDYPSGYKYSQFGINAYDDTKYYASKINTDSIYDEISKMTENKKAGKYDPVDNNCAGTVCAGLDLPYGKLPLPSTIPMKLKLKYPTIKLTSNVTDSQESSNLYNASEDSLLNTNINTLEKHSSDNYLIKSLQKALFEKGYKLPKSTKEDSSFDGIWGDETKEALLNYQIKNKTK